MLIRCPDINLALILNYNQREIYCMDRKVKLVFKILGLNAILIIYVGNRPAPNVVPNKPIWMNDYKLARDKARAEKKPILMYFPGPGRCKPCAQMTTEVFERKKFKTYAGENLVLLKLDFRGQSGSGVQTISTGSYSPPASGTDQESDFPIVLVIDEDENVLVQTGYRNGTAADFVDYLKERLTSF